MTRVSLAVNRNNYHATFDGITCVLLLIDIRVVSNNTGLASRLIPFRSLAGGETEMLRIVRRLITLKAAITLRPQYSDFAREYALCWIETVATCGGNSARLDSVVRRGADRLLRQVAGLPRVCHSCCACHAPMPERDRGPHIAMICHECEDRSIRDAMARTVRPIAATLTNKRSANDAVYIESTGEVIA